MKTTASAVVLLSASVASAQPFSIDWWTIDGGGAQEMSGGAFELSATIGQHDASATLTGGIYELDPGFWPGVYQDCLADWNIDGLVNTSDFLAYLNDYNAVRFGGTFTYRDPDIQPPVGVVNTADFLAFLNIFNLGCP